MAGVRFTKKDKAAIAWAKKNPDYLKAAFAKAGDKDALIKMRNDDKELYKDPGCQWINNLISGRWDKLIDAKKLTDEEILLVSTTHTAGPADEELPEATEEPATVEAPLESTEDEDWDILNVDSLLAYLEEHPRVANHLQLLIFRDTLLLNDQITNEFTELGVSNARAFVETCIDAYENQTLPEEFYSKPAEETAEEPPAAEEKSTSEEEPSTDAGAPPIEKPSPAPVDASTTDAGARDQPINHLDIPAPIIRQLALNECVIADYNPRRDSRYDDILDGLKAAAELPPIEVRALENDRFEIFEGARRYRALQDFGASTIMALVYEIDEHTARILSVQRNLDHRKNLPDYDIAIALDEIRQEDPNVTMKQLGALFFPHKNEESGRYHVSRLLSLLKLPEDVRQLLELEEDESKKIRPLSANIAGREITSLASAKAPPGVDETTWTGFISQRQLELATNYTRNTPRAYIRNSAQNLLNEMKWRAEAIETNRQLLKDRRQTIVNDLRMQDVTVEDGLASQALPQIIDAYEENQGGKLQTKRKELAKTDPELTKLLDIEETIFEEGKQKTQELATLEEQLRQLQRQRNELATEVAGLQSRYDVANQQRKNYRSDTTAEIDQEIDGLTARLTDWRKFFKEIVDSKERIQTLQELSDYKFNIDKPTKTPPADTFPELQDETG